ncbi:MAG TPA: mechanosensitive ion channel family protein [Anaerolineae bacterium]|nr:mechanosensitive ion channel family protein [Anaerolineae bacterium]
MTFLGLSLDQWMDVGIALLIVVLVLLLGRWLVSFVLNRIVGRITRRTKTKLDEAIVSAISKPLFWFLLITALRLALAQIDSLLGDWKAYLPDVYFLLYLLFAAVVLWALIDVLTRWYSEAMTKKAGAKLEKQWMPFLRRMAIILVGVIAISMALAHFDVDISGMIATLGIGSLAIALAAQASLADLINGFLIMIDQPYRVGDRIEILDLDTWGDVVDIGLRSTRVRTRDNRMVIVPNSVIGKSLVVNYSYPDTKYRIQIHVGVAYGTDVELARSTIIDAVQKVEGVLDTQPVEALFLEFGDSAMIFRVRWWIESYVDTRRMFDRVNTHIYHALDAAGVELPPPLRELHHHIDDQNTQRLARALRNAQEGGDVDMTPPITA